MNLSDAITAYLRDRTARGSSKGTVDNDRYVLRLLLADVGNINTQRLRPQHMDVFWSNRTTWGPGTSNRARTHLTVFFKWCQHRGYISSTEVLLPQTRPQRVAPRKRVIIPQSEFSTFLAGNYSDPRARIALALGLYLFVRKSEDTALRWQDWNEDAKTIEVFREKTLTLDTLPVCKELEAELKRWRLEYARLVGSPPRPGAYIIPGRSRPKFRGVAKSKLECVEESVFLPDERASLSKLLSNSLKQSGYYAKFEGGHTLRRSGATALYNQLTHVGHDRAIRICQAMLGHSSITTTEVYLRLDLDRKVRNDLLAGELMFPDSTEGVVVEMRKAAPDGEGDEGGVSL